MLSCVQHKLPKACGTSPGNGLGVKRRFDNGQVFQFEWQAVSFECLFEDGHVKVARAHNVAYRTAQLSAITVDELLHHVVIGHLDNGRYSAKSFNEHLFWETGINVRHVTIGSRPKVFFRIVLFEQTV